MAEPHQEQNLNPAPTATKTDRPPPLWSVAHTPLIFLLFFFLLAGWIVASPQHITTEFPVEASYTVSPIPKIIPESTMSSTEQT